MWGRKSLSILLPKNNPSHVFCKTQYFEKQCNIIICPELASKSKSYFGGLFGDDNLINFLSLWVVIMVAAKGKNWVIDILVPWKMSLSTLPVIETSKHWIVRKSCATKQGDLYFSSFFCFLVPFFHKFMLI